MRRARRYAEELPTCCAGEPPCLVPAWDGTATGGAAGERVTQSGHAEWGPGGRLSASLESSTVVIVPTYNEAENIGPLVAAVMQATPAVDILFVDDASQDGTQDHIARMQHQYGPQVHLLARTGKRGLGAAYIAGFQWALARHYHVMVQMDADLSHDPAHLPHLLRLLASADGVVGSRYVDGGGTRHWSIVRRGLSKAGALYARWLLGLPIQDPTGGYNVWHRRVLEAIDWAAVQSEGYVFQIECKYRASRAGFRVVEAPIVFVDRRVGASKMSTRIVLEAALRTWQLRYAPRADGLQRGPRLTGALGRVARGPPGQLAASAPGPAPPAR